MRIRWLLLIIMTLILLLAIPLVGCALPSEPKPFPPPEGYSSWDEYYRESQQQPASIPIPSPTPTPTPTPPTPEPDTTPPVISEVDISHITESSATIKWKTDEATTCQIEYGQDDTRDKVKDLGSTFKTNHNITLTELETKITYHFRIRALDKSENEALSKDYDFITKTTEELLSSLLYPGITIGGRVHQLSFNLFNGSSHTITVTKVEIFDEHGDVAFTMSKSDIAETWGNGQLDSGKSFSASISFGIPPSTTEVEDWQVKWYCLDADRQRFTVKGLSREL